MSESVITIDPIQDSIAKAIATARTSAATQASAVALTTPGAANNNVMAAMPTRGAALKMDDMQGGLSVDSWLKVKEFGFILGPKGTLSPGDIDVTIDLRACLPCYSIKFGNPATYYKTYDRVTEAKGGGWMDTVARVQKAEPRASEYRACDIPMTVTNDVSDKKEGVLLGGGTTIGYSTPTTGWAEWEKFWRDCASAGLTGGTVKAKLGWTKRSNKNGNTWGIVTFTLVQ